MTATALLQGDFQIVGDGHDTIPSTFFRKLAANQQVGRGQWITVSPTTGYASLNDGTSPGQISGGYGSFVELTGVSATAGLAWVQCGQQWAQRTSVSTIANDSFTDADFGVPFWIKDENTVGKLSNYSGSNRSLGGLVYGIEKLSGTPIVWGGPVAWQLARSALMCNAYTRSYSIADGATAAATISEAPFPNFRQHGVITGIRFVGAAATASDSLYATITVAKRDGAGGAAVTLGTLVTNLATGNIVAFTPKAFTLTATAADLQILETDVITITEAKASTGTALNGLVEVTLKVG